ncbi:MAG: diacylglycerol kinase family protein [Bacteroidetes bacterium]|nr:diacylglycerol kinase family protein [Bacteroidota bacterium]
MKKFFKGFQYAFAGIVYALKTQVNMQFHFVASFVVLFCALYFQISSLEALLLCLAVGIVWITELFNTAIEAVCDRISKDIHPLCKVAKDCAAAAVLIAAFLAIAIGLFVFYKYFLAFFQ